MSLSVEDRVAFEGKGCFRLIREPVEINTPGKLNEWLAECGMPQRDYLPEEIGTPACNEAERMALGTKFPSTDRALATQSWERLIAFVAGAFYGRMSYMADQRIVWRVRPEFTEDPVTRHFSPEGSEVDLVTYRGADLKTVNTGDRLGKFYARFWLEPHDGEK